MGRNGWFKLSFRLQRVLLTINRWNGCFMWGDNSHLSALPYFHPKKTLLFSICIQYHTFPISKEWRLDYGIDVTSLGHGVQQQASLSLSSCHLFCHNHVIEGFIVCWCYDNAQTKLGLLNVWKLHVVRKNTPSRYFMRFNP